MHHRQIISALISLAVALMADSLTISSPQPGQTVSSLNSTQLIFAKLPEDILRPLMEDCGTFCKDLSDNVKSFPAGIHFDWSFQGDRKSISYQMTLSDNPEFRNPRVLKPEHSECLIHNLFPGQTYFWKVAAVYKDGKTLETPVASFTVKDVPPRVMFVSGVDNCRDMGGWTGLEGRKVAYNKIFRNTGLNKNSADGKVPGEKRFDREGELVLTKLMKIRTELDLRTPHETANMTESPLGPAVTYINISSTCYGGLYTDSGRENYARLFRLFCDEKNYPIDFHCIAGADRTGTLAFLLLSTLGVSMDDAAKDYVFTSFYSRRGYERFDILRNGMNAYGDPDEPAVRKTERFLLQSGITTAEIMAFRDIMLGKGTAPGPVLEEYIALEKLLKGYTKRPVDGIGLSCTAIPAKTQMMCGKKISCNAAGDWRIKSIEAYCDPQGGAAFLLYPILGRRKIAIRPAIDSSRAQTRFMMADMLSNTVFTLPDGKDTFTGEEAAALSLPPWNNVIFLQIAPVQTHPLPKEWKRVKADFTPEYDFTTVAVIPPPQIDGVIDDAIWDDVPPHDLLPVAAVEKNTVRNTVKLAVDEYCDVLYLAAAFKDISSVAKYTAHDAPIYNDDCCEIFLSDQNSSSFRQLAVNRNGALYDGWESNASWNTTGVVIRTMETPTGWTLEMAIPLKQMKFDAPLNLNVTYSDYPAAQRFNLVPTGASFHNREAMRPVLIK